MTKQKKKAYEKLIDIGITRKNGIVFCPDLATVSLVVGSKSVAGNLRVYGVKKRITGDYEVSVATIKKRIKELVKRKEKIEQHLKTMWQAIK